ncbi:sugar phosphate isomerase/epimerase family protein [Parafrankia discariae]|uniref:sugar phosphate isomerase/epimerase family protein n=1 Tax=Parafrankia discariae TaxID=365528 RepID=UPI0003AA36DB|nr:sugar phosphate isomerase/epimerase [Parafrankia discariae]
MALGVGFGVVCQVAEGRVPRMAGSAENIGWVMWSGTVGLQRPLAERVEAAVVGGFGRISISPLDVALAEEAGTTPADLGRQLRGQGLGVVLDGLMNWYGGAPMTAARSIAFTADEVLDMCAALRPVSLTAFARPTGDVGLEEIATAFGGLCDRAADVDTLVQLEFMAMMAIRDLPAALAVVAAADRANGGLVFDTWHFFRGNPDFAALEELPGDRVFAVQVSDGPAAPPDDIGRDTFNRLLPGDGGFDLVRLLGVLDGIGALGWVGPEVLSPATEGMPATRAAGLGAARVRELIDQVRAS